MGQSNMLGEGKRAGDKNGVPTTAKPLARKTNLNRPCRVSKNAFHPTRAPTSSARDVFHHTQTETVCAGTLEFAVKREGKYPYLWDGTDWTVRNDVRNG